MLPNFETESPWLAAAYNNHVDCLRYLSVCGGVLGDNPPPLQPHPYSTMAVESQLGQIPWNKTVVVTMLCFWLLRGAR